MSRNFAVGEHLEAFIDSQVHGGHYTNASEVVREALRLLEDCVNLHDMRAADLRQLGEEGRASGLAQEDGELRLDRLAAKYRGMIDRSDAW